MLFSRNYQTENYSRDDYSFVQVEKETNSHHILEKDRKDTMITKGIFHLTPS